jgi:hypothetical protein
MGERMKSAALDLTASALNLPRSARMRLVAALLEKDGDAEGAADYEAAARDAEMDEDPARFSVSEKNFSVFTRKLRREVLARAGTETAGSTRRKVGNKVLA